MCVCVCARMCLCTRRCADRGKLHDRNSRENLLLCCRAGGVENTTTAATAVAAIQLQNWFPRANPFEWNSETYSGACKGGRRFQ